MYNALGYPVNPSNPVINQVLIEQYPHESLVLVVKRWCLTPIKTRGKDFKDSFAHGKAAELLINKSIKSFFENEPKDIVFDELCGTWGWCE